jgi:lysophospholipase L1-like esterase
MSRITRRLLAAATVLAALSGLAASAAVADNYVALGDSYSSGVGTGSYALSSSCLRSVYAYPYLISQQRANTSLTFVACSGAKTTDVLANQVQSLSASTNWVTITIGGNDAGFASTVSACVLGDCSSQIAAANGYIQNTLPGVLDNTYSTIRADAPNARVIVLGYPRLFSSSSCLGTTGISSSERTSMNSTADLLDKTTATEAGKYVGFTYKSAIQQFTGHAICSSSAWLNGLNIFNTTESFHPNRSGHASGYEPLARAVMG